jgi:hypothetical protein
MSSTIHRPRRYRPRLEALEERCLPTTFFVMLPTDNGGPGGQGFGQFGDLRYCLSQADAAHAATQDTIVFLLPMQETITLNSALGPLVLSDAHPLTIEAAYQGQVTISGGDKTEVFDVAGGTVALRNLVISHGAATGAVSVGGGINNAGNLTMTDCILDYDSAGQGGGLFNTGNVTLTGCTLSNDSADGNGGGIFNEGSGTATLTGCTLSNDSALSGGGIANGGTVTLTNCTLSNDSAGFGGGGIANGGTVTLTNCTLSNDSALGGGGIANGGTVTLTNCTLSNDSADGNGGGIVNFVTLNLTNTIVAGNSAPTGPDIDNRGTVGTADHNLIGDGTGSGIINGVNGNQVGGNGNPVIDPRLGPLASNGGPTQTLALLPGSPAHGTADNAAAPHTDQRGHVRLDEAGETTDIGAFEV